METLTMTRPVVLITGGSRGIGAAAARRFARGGWDVAVGYRRSREQAETLAEELEALGARAAALPGDISQRPEAQALVRQAEELLGPLDALVCSAGVAPRQMLLTDLSAPEWREVMSVNLDSASAGSGGPSSPSPPCGGSLAAPVRRPTPPPRRGSSA